MEQENENKDIKEITNKIIYFFGVISGIYFIVKADENIEKFNLGQKFEKKIYLLHNQDYEGRTDESETAESKTAESFPKQASSMPTAGRHHYEKRKGSRKGKRGKKWKTKRFYRKPIVEKIDKYKSTEDNGRNTGKGYALEDVFYRLCEANGLDAQQVKPSKNGADYIVNGVPVQLKCSTSAQGVFKSLFEDGEFRYSGQTIITNKENEEKLRKLIRKNRYRFGGQLPEVNPDGLPKVSQEEIDKQYYRGWSSVKIDAKDIISDRYAQKQFALGFIASFCTIIGIGAIVEYRRVGNTDENGEKITVFKKVKTSLKRSVKKHWKKGILISTIAVAVGLAGHLGKRQLKRSE